eukprot:6588087-Prymnesium_polylepis.1
MHRVAPFANGLGCWGRPQPRSTRAASCAVPADEPRVTVGREEHELVLVMLVALRGRVGVVGAEEVGGVDLRR